MFSILRQASRSRTATLEVARNPTSRIMGARTIISKKYTAEHELLQFDDESNEGVVSITDHAQTSLGDVVFVELPNVGRKVQQGEQIGAVESVKAASDIYAPVSGEILEVNGRLDSEPGLLNRSPESEGWLCKIKLSEPAEVETLLTFEAYKDSIEL